MPVIYFTTVNRYASPPAGGELVKLDWNTKTVLACTPMSATDPVPIDPNPRGSTRGGRGVVEVDGKVFASTYHTLKIFDSDLTELGRLDNANFVNIHELTRTGDTKILVTATAIDAVLEVDLAATPKVRHTLWPREMPGLQAELGLTALAIDKTADNRTRFLDPSVTADASHLHLNAVAIWDGRVHALLSRFGVIADLDRDRVIVRDSRLRAAHNLVVDHRTGRVFVNDTRARTVRVYDLAQGTLADEFPLVRSGSLRLWLAGLNVPWMGRVLARRLGIGVAVARPFFIRGLALWHDHAFVGSSPASVLMLELETGKVVDRFVYSKDVRSCVHGLTVAASAASQSTAERSATYTRRVPSGQALNATRV